MIWDKWALLSIWIMWPWSWKYQPILFAWHSVWWSQHQTKFGTKKSTAEKIWGVNFFFKLSIRWGFEPYCELLSWYFEPSQPQRITSRLKKKFNLSAIHSARKSSNHKSTQNHKINPDTNLHKTQHTQTLNTKLSKNQSPRYHPC